MATVRILSNILEDSVDTFSVDAGVSIEALIREHTTGDSYAGTLVECYDCDTGETFFAPIEDDTATTNAIVQVNQKDVGLDYVIKENDVVSVIITPAGGGGWNWTTAIMGGIEGALTGALIGFAVGNVGGAIAGGIIGFVVGFVGFGILGGMELNDDGSSSSGLDSESLPDVRGSQNQPLTDPWSSGSTSSPRS